MNEKDIQFADFWTRLGAQFIDFLIFSSLVFFGLFISRHNLNYYLISNIFFLFFINWYQIFLLKKYGATPGKKILNITVTNIDNSKLLWKDVILRNLFNIISNSIFYILIIFSILKADSLKFENLGLLKKMNYINDINSIPHTIMQYSTYLWVLINIVCVIINKKNRAIHDLIAGTIVVNKKKELN